MVDGRCACGEYCPECGGVSVDSKQVSKIRARWSEEAEKTVKCEVGIGHPLAR